MKSDQMDRSRLRERRRRLVSHRIEASPLDAIVSERITCTALRFVEEVRPELQLQRRLVAQGLWSSRGFNDDRFAASFASKLPCV